MRRVALLAAFLAVAVMVPSSAAKTPLSLFVSPSRANAGDVATVRIAGTPAGFTLADRRKPFQKGIRVYLVSRAVAGEVSSRFDPRLSFVGRIVPDRNGRGIVGFRVPALDSGPYAIAAWCPGCRPSSVGRSFFVQTVPRTSRTTLQVRLPSATETCPVTGEGAYGNGFLATQLPADGVFGAVRRPDGTLFVKRLWVPTRGNLGWDLVVRGERLDGPGELRVLRVSWGGGSWASAMTFSTEGCWRIVGRMGDIALSYVVKVVAGP